MLQFLFYFMKGAPWLQWRPVTNDMHAPLVWYGDDGVSQLALVFLHLVFFHLQAAAVEAQPSA